MGVEEAKTLLERDGYKMLDVRDWKSYDKEHLTKPPQCTANVPLGDGDDLASFVARVRDGGFRDGAKLLVADAAGPGGVAAADALADAGSRTSSASRAGTTDGEPSSRRAAAGDRRRGSGSARGRAGRA